METPASLVQLVTRIKWIICSASSVPLQESAIALFSREEKWTIRRHAPFKDYISEASAFNRCTGGSEIVTTQTVCDHRGFKDVSALQAIEHVRAVSERHQPQLCWGNVFCMAGKSKECTQGAVCFYTCLQKPYSLSKCTTVQHPAPKPSAVTVRVHISHNCSNITLMWSHIASITFKYRLGYCGSVRVRLKLLLAASVTVALFRLLFMCARLSFTFKSAALISLHPVLCLSICLYNMSYYTSIQALWLSHLFVFAPAVLGCIFP